MTFIEVLLVVVSFIAVGLFKITLGYRASLKEAESQIQELKDKLKELEQLVVTDHLTGLLDRRGLEKELSRELARSRREGSALAIMVIDLDHFKKINDERGHARGDRFLRDFTSLLRRRLREQDLVGRIGGEEFVVVLQAALEEAAAVAESLRAVAEEKLALTVEDGLLAGTLSIGVCTFNSMEHVDGEALIAAADRLMYQAKQRRNCIIAADC